MLFLLYVNTLFIGCGSDIKIKSQEPSDDTNNEASSEPSNEVSSEVSSEPSSEVSSEPASEVSSEPSSDPMLLPFNEAIFASTHNTKNSCPVIYGFSIKSRIFDPVIKYIRNHIDLIFGNFWWPYAVLPPL